MTETNTVPTGKAWITYRGKTRYAQLKAIDEELNALSIKTNDLPDKPQERANWCKDGVTALESLLQELGSNDDDSNKTLDSISQATTCLGNINKFLKFYN